MAGERRTPLDQVLDVCLYAPVGLAVTARDEIPSLVEKGRQRLTSQVDLARMVGILAVRKKRRDAERVAGRLAAQATVVAERLTGVGGAHDRAGRPDGPEREHGPGPTGGGAGPEPAPGPVGGGGARRPARSRANGSRSADGLAIPGYDSLSASQVVQRLAGLSLPELEAVRSYEDASRGRRTILAKVAQLQSAEP